MADEIRVTASIEVNNGNLKLPRIGREGLLFTQGSPGGPSPGTISIGTAEEDITFTDITSNGWLYMLNLDETNYVQWGPKSAGAMVPVGRMYPGQPVLFHMDVTGLTLRMKANTAACKVLILGFQF